jgi:hypothetical protein
VESLLHAAEEAIERSREGEPWARGRQMLSKQTTDAQKGKERPALGGKRPLFLTALLKLV